MSPTLPSGAAERPILAIATIVFRPIIRFCVKNAIALQDILTICKRLMIEEAERELKKNASKVTISRLSVLTGVHRKDVEKLYRNEGAEIDRTPDILSRVLSRWQHDKQFLTAAGKPRVLSKDGPHGEFHRLVRKVSTNVNPATVLFELNRRGSVTESKDGVRLASQIVSVRPESHEIYNLAAQDIENLLESVRQNLITFGPLDNLYMRTEYDNIFEGDLIKIRKFLANEGVKLHRRARAFLSKSDRDLNPAAAREGDPGTVVLTTFSLTQPMPKSK